MKKNMRRRSALALFTIAMLLVPTAAVADEPGFVGPLFGLGTDGTGAVIVADAGQGVAKADGTLIAPLPNVTDVAASDKGWIWAITGGGSDPGDATLYKVTMKGKVTAFADLGAYEAKYNPHPTEVDSNPFSVVDLGGGEAVVADAGGNTLLKVDKHGKVKLIAVLPDELVPTDNLIVLLEEALAGLVPGATCANVAEKTDELEAALTEFFGEDPETWPFQVQELVGLCDLPPMIPTEAVATSVAIGPNGDFYVGELKGFPGPLDESRVWRIRWNARNADCSRSPLCSVAYDGFTSIVDLAFGDDGTLYVAEMDEKSFLAVELGLFLGLSIEPGLGTINACKGGTCTVAEGNIPFLSALTVDGDGTLWQTGLFGDMTTSP